MSAASVAAITTDHDTPSLSKTKSYEGQSVPQLTSATPGNVRLWAQVLYQFCGSLKPITTGDGEHAAEHKIVDVLFKAEDHEDNATCVSAMTTILMHGLGKYYDQCMSDSIACDGATAQTEVKIANGFRVHTINVHIVWARALKLCELKNSGLTADDLESAPYTYFSQSNATYPSAMTFVEGLDHIVSWTLAWAERMRMCDRATSDGRVLTIIRNAITIVLPELDHDNLVGYDKLGTDTGMHVFLRRLAAKRDNTGVKVAPTLAVSESSNAHHAGGESRTCYNCGKLGHIQKDCRQGNVSAGRGRGRGQGGRGRGGGRGGGRGRTKNRDGMTCHQCGSEYHLVADCSSVPPAQRAQAVLLANAGQFTQCFWQDAEGTPTHSAAFVSSMPGAQQYQQPYPPQQQQPRRPRVLPPTPGATPTAGEQYFVLRGTELEPYDPFGG